MGEFDDFAAEMEAAHGVKQREHEEQLKQEEIARQRLWGTAQDYLEAEVLPILDEAKAAFERKGFRVELNTSWQKRGSLMRPEVTFQVFGQKKRASDTPSFGVSGDIGKVWHDGADLFATISSGAYYRNKTFEGSGIDAVREMAKRALASLYEMLDPAKH
jgi:hypothetical protein